MPGLGLARGKQSAQIKKQEAWVSDEKPALR